ncbi:hypothetical protein [Streptacidiphilus sp. EB129]|uniref:hypothetical protein n=1 Tax=Streptacidiphilus sp. EB129 TaxID=3156262 RepID=UPI00351166AA
MSHHLHIGPGLLHRGHHSHRSGSPAVGSSAVLWVIFALVVIALVIASGANALPGQ